MHDDACTLYRDVVLNQLNMTTIHEIQILKVPVSKWEEHGTIIFFE